MPASSSTGPRVLIAGWIGAGNLGDELIHDQLRRGLRARGIEVTALSEDPVSTGRTHGDAVGLLGAVREIESADGFVLGGGGLLQDATSVLNVVRHGLLPAHARLRRRASIAIGLGLGPLDTGPGRRLGAGVLRSISGPVVLRDEASVDLARSIGVDDTQLGCDLVLGRRVDTSPTEPHLVVSLRPRLRHRRHDHATDDRDVAAWAESLTSAARSTDTTVRFVSMDPMQDDDLHRRVGERLGVPHELVQPDLGDVDRLFATATAVIAMRYHAAVMALVAGRPLVLAPYAPKVAALTREFHLDGTTVDLDTLAALEPALIRAISTTTTDVMEVMAERRAVNEAALDTLAAEVTR